MGFKKTMTDILNSLPVIKNKIYKSAGVYASETDNTGTGRTNKTDGFTMSTDPLGGDDTMTLTDRKIVINRK